MSRFPYFVVVVTTQPPTTEVETTQSDMTTQEATTPGATTEEATTIVEHISPGNGDGIQGNWHYSYLINENSYRQ